MPKRTDLETILIIGSGPIVIGQACEFDYSGTQACRVLRAEGYRVVLVNSNPATIMTDPEFADATYVEPLDLATLTRIIERERPDAVLPTLGGQTALNLAIELHDAGVLEQFDVELIGASVVAIRTAENRHEFKAAMEEIGLVVPRSGFAYTLEDALAIADQVGYPLIVRPSFILGGGGTGMATNADEMRRVAEHGLATSPVSEILVEQSVAGWKEFELEVMRDHADNVVVVCSIENFDAMGVHTGDSITVAPAQTLTDVEYQRMRDAAFVCIRRIGVDTGGSNIQFALESRERRHGHHRDESARLAQQRAREQGHRLSHRQDRGAARGGIPARRDRERHHRRDARVVRAHHRLRRHEGAALGVREAPGRVAGARHHDAVGRRSDGDRAHVPRVAAEGDAFVGDGPRRPQRRPWPSASTTRTATTSSCGWSRRPPPSGRSCSKPRLRRGVPIERLHDATGIDPWFLDHILELCETRAWLEARGVDDLGRSDWRRVKRLGFSDAQLAYFWGVPEEHVFATRKAAGVDVTYKTVDTCAAEFAARTPYHYGTYEDEDEVESVDRPAVVILGSGPEPHRAGRRVRLLLRARRVRLVRRRLRDRHAQLQPRDGVHRLRHQRPPLLRAAHARGRARGVPPPAGALDRARRAGGRDRRPRWADAAEAGAHPRSGRHSRPRHQPRLDRPRRRPRALPAAVRGPRHRAAAGRHRGHARSGARGGRAPRLPVLVRPSYVLGGRAMQIVFDVDGLDEAMAAMATEGIARS